MKWNSSFVGKHFWQKACCCVLLTMLVSLVNIKAGATPVLVVTDHHSTHSIDSFIQEYVDTANTLSIDAVNGRQFIPSDGKSRIYSPTVNSVWLRFRIRNNSSYPSLFLNIPYPNLSVVTLYRLDGTAAKLVAKEGNDIEVVKHPAGSPNIIMDLQLAAGEEKDYILHVHSIHPIILPAFVSTEPDLHESIGKHTMIMGLYFGVLLIMFLYNLFLFFATRDNNYLSYTIYLFLLALAQLAASGYGYRFLWPGYRGFNQFAVITTSSLSAISGLFFSMLFLNTRSYSPKAHRIILFGLSVFVIGILASFFGFFTVSYSILNYNSLLSVIVILIASIFIAQKGFKPAYFYLVAWFALLLSFIILILRNLNVLPYNTFTAYIFYIGSTVEVSLLSIALADKINTLRRDKETMQAEALRVSLENEKLVRQLNLELEAKVAERTEELQKTNDQLTEAFSELKDAQIQLVEAEKMASLGQLTAGIAHEINNPINFVKSNIKPLQLDFKDMVEVIDEYEKLHTFSPDQWKAQLEQIHQLKKDVDLDFIKGEIDNLLKGIKEGAERTADIVRGLRTFSRLDESQIKTVNIHEGIESTLVLLRNSSPDNIKITVDFKVDGNIECFPGKLNQVFMNIISNAIQAVKAKDNGKEPESIHISTRDVAGDQVEIRIKDSGIGMPPEVKQKIFDPFFTTKAVGEGTGLGLAIVFKIIQEHSGKIDVISSEGQGAEFIITLHNTIPEKPTT